MKLNVYGNMPIITPRDPVVPMEAANKNYVDTMMSTHAGNMELHLTAAQNTLLDNLTVTHTEINRLSGVTENVQTQIDNRVPLTGGVMSGFLTLSGAPTANLHAATKGYVDTQDALKVSKAGDTMTGDLTLAGDPTSLLHAAPKQYVDATVNSHAGNEAIHLTAAQNTFLDSVTVTATEVNRLSGVTDNVQTQLDSKVALAGGTMTGLLVLSANPVANLGAATKGYVDTQDALKVSKTGDTMTGALVLPGDPTAALEAAPKQYVDNSVSGHAGNEAIHLTAAQNTLLDAITVDASEINHLDGVTGNVQTQIDGKVAKTGGTMTGALNLPAANPATATEATHKGYVDAQDALKVSKAGDTMTGALVLPGDPTAALEATPKQYVDSTVSGHANDAALHLTAAQNTLLDGITVSHTEINQLAGVTSAVQTQIDSKFDKTGGNVSGDITLAEGKTIFVSKVPSAGTELVNKAYVDSLANGQKWEDPVSDINLVDDSLSTPPASPVVGDVYIVGATATDAWAGKEGFATYHNGTEWVFLQDRAVAIGDRFGVSLLSATVAAGGVVGKDGGIVTVTNATPGAITYSDDVLGAASTTLVFDPTSSKFGVTYTRTDEGNWVPTNTSVNLTAGAGLSMNGNTLNFNAGAGLVNNDDTIDVKVDGASGVAIDGANAVTLKRDGTTISASATGIKVADAVIADIADRVSKSTDSTVDAVVTISATGGLKVTNAPAVAADAANKAYVDAGDAALQSQVTQNTNDIDTLQADAVTKSYVDTQDALKVSKAGDTMTGPLVLPADPTAALQAAPKQYVDNSVNTHATDAALHLTAAQNTFLDAVTVTAAEVNHLSGVTSSVQTQIDNRLPLSGGTMTGAIVLAADPVELLEPATKQYTDAADALAVKKAGDTMTGHLTLNADPTSALHSATKQYVDTGLSGHATDAALHLTTAQNTFLDGLTITHTEANRLQGVTSNVQTQLDSKLPLTGGTLTGVLTLDADPATALEAATKQYVDNGDSLKVNKAGDTMTGALVLPGAPTSALEAATKGYVDTNLGSHASDASLHITAAQNTFLDGITVTHTEVNHVAGVSSNIQTQLDAKLNLTGGTLSGFLTLHAAPTAVGHAATKKYVDDQDALKVSKAGDTMSGALVLHADPATAMEASTKQYVDSTDAARKTYVDNQDALAVKKAGDTMTGFLTLNAEPTADLHAATKLYVDTKDTTQKTYIDEQDAAIQSQVNTIKATVDTLNADPVTKSYVDSQDATKLAIAGGTMTGYITLHADPQQTMHPATKQYVDAVAQGLSTKPSVRFATTGNLGAVYANGTGGVNATLTGSINGALVVDGKTTIVGDRVLVKDQTNKLENGDYVVQQVGGATTPFILRRVSTVDESTEVPGSYFYVYDGDTLKGTGWVFTVLNPVTFTIGTDDINVNQFSGQGSVIAGDGLTMDGNTIRVNSANSTRIVVNADNIDLAPTAVSPGTYTKVTVDGYGRVTGASSPNTLAGYGITDGQQLNANLTSLSGVATTGIIVRDNTNTMVTKAVTASGVGISVTNGSGAAAGDITVVSNATSANTGDAIVSRDASGNFAANIITASLAGNATTATTLATARNFSITGDVTATAVSFNGGAPVALATTLSDTGVVAGDYTKVAVDAKGRVTGGSNPNTAAGLGIQDVYTKAEVDAITEDLKKQIAELHLYIMSRI